MPFAPCHQLFRRPWGRFMTIWHHGHFRDEGFRFAANLAD
ncbi:hypothetical protein HMPREF9622_00833 [Cutibacterium modestum HL037PA3]|uniref:Uncharacterized protein n=1 Tax=Cutibacterium modestum HL044PA1 TaxID=765109 RepID=A0ABN0C3A1_9ACTN|nr:hypothetical protein HMPREF9621_00446 [Cutibacterium modestum HL037PA2]EFS91702.1 hypothetical protein HMPREF9607_02209 [Cutibacterium modestum HL044PA1]EFT15973.1 hypothetical protein HMPREF9622_00833 [Cutibacterium modestum HL037PA3]